MIRTKLTLKQRTMGLLLCASVVVPAMAQVSYDTPGATYSQDWGNGYVASTNAWTDNSIFAGWYLYQHGTLGAPANYFISTTTAGTTTGRFYLIAAAADTSNFGFGGRVSDGTSGTLGGANTGFYLGLRLSNDTGAGLGEFSLGYTAAQFAKAANATPNNLTVAYQVGSPANLVDGTWTEIPSLAFTSPKADTNSAVGLDFNDPSNQTVFSPVTVSALSWDGGTDLWIRFKIDNVGGIDHGLLIDDINFVAVVPEPSTYAMLLGGLAFGLIAIYRRRN